MSHDVGLSRREMTPHTTSLLVEYMYDTSTWKSAVPIQHVEEILHCTNEEVKKKWGGGHLVYNNDALPSSSATSPSSNHMSNHTCVLVGSA